MMAEKSVEKELEGLSDRISTYYMDLREAEDQAQKTEDELKWFTQQIEEQSGIVGETRDKLFNRMIAIDSILGLSFLDFMLKGNPGHVDENMAVFKYLLLSGIEKLRSDEDVLANLKMDMILVEYRYREKQEMSRRIEAALEKFTDARMQKLRQLEEMSRQKTSNMKTMRTLKGGMADLRKTLYDMDLKERLKRRIKGESGILSFVGKLPFPVNGKVVKGFGRVVNPLHNTVVFNRGIDLKVSEKVINAVFDGKVVYTGWMKGFGNMCIIYHGDNVYSLYANLDKITAGSGTKVRKGENVGMVSSINEIVHFEIRYGAKPQDPLLWLNSKT